MVRDKRPILFERRDLLVERSLKSVFQKESEINRVLNEDEIKQIVYLEFNSYLKDQNVLAASSSMLKTILEKTKEKYLLNKSEKQIQIEFRCIKKFKVF